MATLVLGAGVALVAGFGGWKWLNKYKEPAMTRFWHFPEDSSMLLPSRAVEFDRTDDDRRYAASSRIHPRIGSHFNLRPRYTALQPVIPQTRLLVIDSIVEDKISCVLYNVNLSTLSTTDTFSALSYQWDRSIKLIVLNGDFVEVTESVFLALKELYRRGRRRVWVDALCIDQRNDAEKVHQMAYMHNIYSMAREVIVWLGPSDTWSDIVSRSIRDVEEFRAERDSFGPFLFDLVACWAADQARINPEGSKLYQKQQHNDQRPNYTKAKAMFASNKREPQLEAFNASLQASAKGFLLALKHVVERGYWRRAWIIQELTAARQLEVWCGSSCLDYTSLVSILKNMEQVSGEGSYVGLSFCHKHILGLDHLKGRWKPDEAIHLLEALRDSYHTRCSDKFDEIYALLGMCFNSRRFVPVTDYGISMEELLLRMTENHIMSSGSLDVICMRMRGASAFDLPSWAPDWRLIGRETFNNRMISYLVGEDQRPKPHKNERRWTASGSSSWSPSAKQGHRTLLAVQCRFVGKIKWLEPSTRSELTTLTMSKTPTGTDDEEEDIYTIVFDTIMCYKVRDRVDDSRDEWKHVFYKRALKRIAAASPGAHRRLTNILQHVTLHGKTLRQWSAGVPESLDHNLDFSSESKAVTSALIALYNYTPYALRSMDRLLRHDYKQHVLPSSARSRTLEDALIKVLDDEMPLMQVEAERDDVGSTSISGGGGGGGGGAKDKPSKRKWYLGWAHPHAQVGDQVCLLEGCTLPVILRKQSDGFREDRRPVYSLVGDAHVTGIMSGQMWPTTPRKRAVLQEILLA